MKLYSKGLIIFLTLAFVLFATHQQFYKEAYSESPVTRFRLLAIEQMFDSINMKSAQFFIEELLQYPNWNNSTSNCISQIHLLTLYNYTEVDDEVKPFWRGKLSYPLLQSEIIDFLGSASPGEIVLLYYCGHSQMSYAPPPPYSWWCGITPQKLSSWINATNLTQACFTLILDTCFSGYWTSFSRNVTVLSACGRDESAWGGGWNDGPCGIFTVGLFNSFQIENDTNADGWLSLAEIFPYAKNYTTAQVTWSRQNPECHYGLVEGDIPLLQINVSKPFPIWDVSITSFLIDPIVRPDSLVPINLTVANHGVKNVTFDITIYSNKSKIQLQEAALKIGENATFTFILNTTGFYGDYLLRFTLSICPCETNTLDNAAEASIYIAIQGDVNCDGSVNNQDVTIFKSCFGSEIGDPSWNLKADLNNDDYINFLDAILLGVNFGESYP